MVIDDLFQMDIVLNHSPCLKKVKDMARTVPSLNGVDRSQIQGYLRALLTPKADEG